MYQLLFYLMEANVTKTNNIIFMTNMNFPTPKCNRPHQQSHTFYIACNLVCVVRSLVTVDGWYQSDFRFPDHNNLLIQSRK